MTLDTTSTFDTTPTFDTRPIDLVTPLHRVVAAISDAMPRESWPFWFDGWPQDSEAALLDAIFSSRATYGTAATGVRKVVTSWRAWRGDASDDLSSFALLSPEELLDILGNRQRVSGNRMSKAEAVRDCAALVVGFGVRSVGELAALDSDGLAAVREAVLGVAGVGPASWDVFVGSSGVDVAALDRHVAAFVSEACTRDVPDVECRDLIANAAIVLQVDVATVRHSIWRYQRKPRI
ncbi:MULTISPECIES: hypothetical protein [unclassified Rhodococcus (in: high G+C Gram-positive bacteria)]|uniref:hypothetical protein n=1 Tax=unclassified Rhodococcus (in: high G+C Gram-positive bacteria) TaxID=192944 RepID=UPI000AE93713|nr:MULTISPECIES: hypothetical protein [unclassified Rhodococcus (in: high G+C Gram-positive bacteria)]